MSNRVDKWLKKGRKNCNRGEHWYILQYPAFLICAICGHKEEADRTMPEYNYLLVEGLKIEPVKSDYSLGHVGIKKLKKDIA